LASGQPLAEARRQMRRTRQSLPLPTGEATTATSIFWNATPVASATPHTKGSWIQLVAATTADIYGLLVFSTTNTSSSAADSSSLLDVGVGASGSEVVAVADLAMGYRGAGLGASGAEVVAVPNICATASSAESLTPTDQGAWLVDVPAGTRIAARYQIASLATTLDAIVYGIR
jgi:hypothetical protein